MLWLVIFTASELMHNMKRDSLIFRSIQITCNVEYSACTDQVQASTSEHSQVTLSGGVVQHLHIRLSSSYIVKLLQVFTLSSLLESSL